MGHWIPGGSDGKEPTCNAGDPGSIPGSGRSPEGNGYPFQCSCLESPMDRGAWRATQSTGSQRDTTEWLTYTHTGYLQLPWGFSGKESSCLCRRRELDPWIRKTPWRKKWWPTPVILAWEIPWARSTTVHGGHKMLSQTWLSNLTTKTCQRLVLRIMWESRSQSLNSINLRI